MTRDNSNDRNILPNVGDDPIAAAEALLVEFGGARKQLYHSIAKALAIAEVLEANDEKWTAFKAHVARKGLHVCKDPLRGVMCFIFTVRKPGGPAYDRACCYTRAVQQLRKEEAASAANIAELIRTRGGVEELYAEAKAARVANKEGAITSRDNARADHEGDSAHDGGNATKPAGVLAGEADNDAQARSTAMANQIGLPNGGKRALSKNGGAESPREPRKFTKEWCEQRLVLEISPAKLQQVLQMDHRQRGCLDFAFGGKDETGFKIYNVDRLQLN